MVLHIRSGVVSASHSSPPQTKLVGQCSQQIQGVTAGSSQIDLCRFGVTLVQRISQGVSFTFTIDTGPCFHKKS